MIGQWKVLLLVTMVVGALFAIGLKTFPYGREGVEAVYIAKDSPARGLVAQGAVITQLNGQKVTGLDDWNSQTRVLQGNVTLTANGKSVVVEVNGSLGINAIGIQRTNLNFGLDLTGGTRVILKPEGNATDELIGQTIAVLETRANLFGLREIKFASSQDLSGQRFIYIEAAGVGNDIVDELLSTQGTFEAKVLKPVDAGQALQLGTERFAVDVLGNDTIRVNGSVVQPNETFLLRDVPFQYLNQSDGRLLFLATVFDGDDIELVYTDPQRSAVVAQGDFYQFFFEVLISLEGAQRFADVTTGIPKLLDVGAGEEYLDSALLLYLDEELVSSLRIGASLGGQVVQSPQVSGSETTQDAALKEKLRLQTILKSGALPVAISQESVDVISATLGIGFFEAALKAALLAGAVVFVIVFAKYRRVRIALPMTLVALSEAVILLGIAAANDAAIWGVVLLVNLAIVGLAWLKKHDLNASAMIGAALIPLLGMVSWTIDLPAIAGIIAVIGTGMDHLIIISDESLRGARKIFGIREQLKMAFFIIFGAAATMIFAMLPLMFVGVGLVRGFAITTIVGVLVGILVTRPAYARLVETSITKDAVPAQAS